MKIIGLSIFILLLCFSFSTQQDQDTRDRLNIVRSEVPLMNNSDLTLPRTIDSGCMIGGCFNEVCMNLASNMTMTCNYPFRNEFKCYERANCRLLADGRCDWDPKDTLNDCLRSSRAGIRPLEEPRREELMCITDGCFNEFCHDVRLPSMMLDRCDYRPEFECLRLTRCRSIDDRCEFEMTRDFRDCMDSLELVSGRDERRLRRNDMRPDVMRVKETRRSDFDLRRDETRPRTDTEDRNVRFFPGEFRREIEFRTEPEFEFRRDLDIDFRRGVEFEARREPEFNYRRDFEGFPIDFPIRESKMVSDTGRMKKQV
jgi:hypothetical protein